MVPIARHPRAWEKDFDLQRLGMVLELTMKKKKVEEGVSARSLRKGNFAPPSLKSCLILGAWGAGPPLRGGVSWVQEPRSAEQSVMR